MMRGPAGPAPSTPRVRCPRAHGDGTRRTGLAAVQRPHARGPTPHPRAAHPHPGGMSVATPVEAPMVGKVLDVQVSVGDTVDEDDTLIVMEAMKMEINVVAPVAGRVAEIRVAAGDAVETDQVLAVIE